MLIFDDNEALTPEELARRTGYDLRLIQRVVTAGCPTIGGRISHSTFTQWTKEHIADSLPEFAVGSLPASGCYLEDSQLWLLWPAVEWRLNQENSVLEVGGAGNGTLWVLRTGEDGIFAYFPIEHEFVWKAKDGPSLVSGWSKGDITV